MAGRELGFAKTGAYSLREQLARTTLRNMRLQGHTYIELREDGKRVIFFCTLCLAPCYSDSVLFDHLKGNLHTERYAAAKSTLLKPNPWPFSDGVLFFHGSSEQDKYLTVSNANRFRLLDTQKDDENNLVIVDHGESLRFTTRDGHVSHDGFVCNEKPYSTGVETDCDNISYNRDLNGNGESNHHLVIPCVLHKDEISDLEVMLMGAGQIAARLCEKDGVSKGMSRIWCEWLGKKDSCGKDAVTIPEHDFAVVTFAYNYSLGRKGFTDDGRYLLLSSPSSECARKKRRKSFSDPDDISESLSNQYNSSGEESLSSDSSNSRLLFDGYDDQLLHSRVISSKTMRRELRRQQHVAAGRMCDICQQKMLLGKDVATLLNRKTGKIVCSSRNVNGAFHVFHVSCLVHWILLREFELYTKPLLGPKEKRRSRRKNGAKFNKKGKEGKIRAKRKELYMVFCPECQGTGINVDGDELEKPTVPLSEVFRYKIKVSDARRAWTKTPEVLQNCSTGFHFPSQGEETIQEKVSPLKLLYFYCGDE